MLLPQHCALISEFTAPRRREPSGAVARRKREGLRSPEEPHPFTAIRVYLRGLRVAEIFSTFLGEGDRDHGGVSELGLRKQDSQRLPIPARRA